MQTRERDGDSDTSCIFRYIESFIMQQVSLGILFFTVRSANDIRIEVTSENRGILDRVSATSIHNTLVYL